MKQVKFELQKELEFEEPKTKLLFVCVSDKQPETENKTQSGTTKNDKKEEIHSGSVLTTLAFVPILPITAQYIY